MNIRSIWDLHRRAILTGLCVGLVGITAILMFASGDEGGSEAAQQTRFTAPGQQPAQGQPSSAPLASQGKGTAKPLAGKPRTAGSPRIETGGQPRPTPNVPGSAAEMRNQSPVSHPDRQPQPTQPPPASPPVTTSKSSPSVPMQESSGGYGGDAPGGREDGKANGGAGGDEPGGRQD